MLRSGEKRDIFLSLINLFLPRTMKRKGEGRERRAETPNCFALQEIITGAGQVGVCPHEFGVRGSVSCWDCVHIKTHLLALTGT